ncbi:hypothetical protein, partial [Vibrio sp. DNB22_19_2]
QRLMKHLVQAALVVLAAAVPLVPASQAMPVTAAAVFTIGLLGFLAMTDHRRFRAAFGNPATLEPLATHTTLETVPG